MKAMLLSALMAPMALGQRSPADQPSCYAIENARIVVRPGQILEQGTLVVRDGRIDAVGDVQVPFDAERIDGKGLVLYAGFIDAHSSLGIPPSKPEEDRGAVPAPNVVEDPLPAMEDAYRKGVRPQDAVEARFGLDADAGKALRECGFTAVVSAPEDGFVAGQSALVSLSGAPRREALINPHVAMQAALSAPGGGYPGTPMGAMAYLRQLLLDAQRYPRAWAFYRAHRGSAVRPDLDESLEAMQPVLSGTLPIVFRADEYLPMRMALNLADEFQLHCMIDGAKSAQRIVDRLAARKVPLLVRIDFPAEPKREEPKADAGKKPDAPPASPAATAGTGATATEQVAQTIAAPAPSAPAPDAGKPQEKPEPEEREPDPVFQDRRRRWEEAVHNLAVLDERQVPFALTTAGCDGPKKFFENLRAAVHAGLKPDSALAALTTTPARLFSAQDDLGTLEVGKLAHVTACDGDFLDEKSAVRFVIVDGRKFESKAKPKPKPGEPKPGDGKPAALAGTWTVNVDSPHGNMTSTLTLEQTGTELSGTMKSEMGTAKVKGSVDGSDVSLTVTIDMGGRSMDLTMSGKLEGEVLSGSVDSPFGPSTFKAERTPRS